MEKGWVLLIRSKDRIYLEILHKMLLNNNINAVILDQDNIYGGSFNEAEVYVNEENLVKAVHLIKSNKDE